MKNIVIFGSVVIALGFLIALGPQFLFKVCGIYMTEEGVLDDCCADEELVEAGCCDTVITSYPQCHWSARAEIGIGFLIAALGACMIVFTDAKTHLGLLIGVFMASMIALAIPNFLIGGCNSLAMQCRRIAFPALTVESIILLIFSAVLLTVSTMQKPSASDNAA